MVQWIHGWTWLEIQKMETEIVLDELSFLLKQEIIDVH